VLGQGSVFTLTIPTALGDPSKAARSAELSVRKRVLLIDDDDTFRYVMRQIIGSEARYEFVEASGGDEGLRIAREQKPDVIILDLRMPAIDGFTVLQELSVDDRTSVIPIIVSTSLTINAELKARLPPGTRLIAKNTISRENVSLFLRDATRAAP
jgi:CheY-like chemotaxis protein